MSKLLKNKVSIITGANQGIGKSIAIEFAKEGCNLLLNSISEEIKHVASDMNQYGIECLYYVGDISDIKVVTSMVDNTIGNFGKIDLLINNAGIQNSSSSLDLSVQDWEKVINTNLKGTFLCSQQAAKHMVKRKQGCIINISSVHQTIPKPHYVHYASSKGGVEMLTKTLALEFSPFNIRVNAVAPGAINTPMNEDVLDDQEKMNKLLKNIPLSRIGEPEEVAWLVTYLASDKAKYITGTTFFIDGGMSLCPSLQISY